MSHIYLKLDVLKVFCEEAFQRFGFTKEEAQIITDVLLLSDKYGIESHGMQRLVRYHKGIRNNIIKVHAKPEIVFETPVSAVIEGHDGMGQLIGVFGMKTAIEKAKKSGMAIVTARNSNHYGIAGYYAKMASDQGLIGMSFTNSEAIMVPTFARKAMLGSNPIAISAPADPYPFFFDASTTVVTRGKLEMYHKAEKPLHDGWALDENGKACNDAGRVLKNISGKKGGGIMPLGRNEEYSGSHKGYGYGMICEIFTSGRYLPWLYCHRSRMFRRPGGDQKESVRFPAGTAGCAQGGRTGQDLYTRRERAFCPGTRAEGGRCRRRKDSYRDDASG